MSLVSVQKTTYESILLEDAMFFVFYANRIVQASFVGIRHVPFIPKLLKIHQDTFCGETPCSFLTLHSETFAH